MINGQPMEGLLYIVATPIGNLKDITIRAIEVLKEADLIIAENRPRALKLLNHLGIRKPITAINSYNEDRRAKGLVDQMAHGKQCALITSAGTPCISDPGNLLVRRCCEAGVEVRAVPGPSAAVAAISISGLFADRFLFFGFLPQKTGKKRKVFRELLSLPYPLVFFESPRRLMDTLQTILEELGNRHAVVLKEMTKVHEGALRGRIADLIEELRREELKGEYSIIVGGSEA
jgi:16S rRNA (cytidine1402-2'-O)-methyltransferase